MILNSEQKESIEINGGSSVSQFTIAMNAKAFRVLSDTLYKDKIGSIVRELSCNAVDSQIQAGKSGEQFDIHLPDAFEPWFSVRDYGIGLSDEQIKSVFTVYFESSKDDSNDTIGAFGLGAKTPFSYTDQFTVKSVIDGTATVYGIYINDAGIPSVSMMDKYPTDEERGVEIMMQVKHSDFQNFKNAVATQLQFFKVKPRILNVGSFAFQNFDTIFECNNFKIVQVNNYHNIDGTHGVSAYAVQGDVGYKLDLVNVPSLRQFVESYGYGKNCSFLFNFNIGEIGVTASREGVEYTEATIANIDKVVNETIQVLIATAKTKIDQTLPPYKQVLAYYRDNSLGGFMSYASKIIPQSEGLNNSDITIQYSTNLMKLFKPRLRYIDSIDRMTSVYRYNFSDNTKILIADSNRNLRAKIEVLGKSVAVIDLKDGLTKDVLPSTVELSKLFGGIEVFLSSEVVVPKAVKQSIEKERVKHVRASYYIHNGSYSRAIKDHYKQNDSDLESVKDHAVVYYDNNISEETNTAIMKYRKYAKFKNYVPKRVILVRNKDKKYVDKSNIDLVEFVSTFEDVMFDAYHGLYKEYLSKVVRCQEFHRVFKSSSSLVKLLPSDSELGKLYNEIFSSKNVFDDYDNRNSIWFTEKHPDVNNAFTLKQKMTMEKYELIGRIASTDLSEITLLVNFIEAQTTKG